LITPTCCRDSTTSRLKRTFTCKQHASSISPCGDQPSASHPQAGLRTLRPHARRRSLDSSLLPASPTRHRAWPCQPPRRQLTRPNPLHAGRRLIHAGCQRASVANGHPPAGTWFALLPGGPSRAER